MGRGLTRILKRIRELAAAGAVRFTMKAEVELAALRLDEGDAHDVLARLSVSDFVGTVSSEATGESMHVFKPWVFGVMLYVKVVVRDACVVVSFHEDEGSVDGEKTA
ncbi:MAG TPA: type II toxin-antitoxin system MqsR family toxin [Polyangiaceae bacterium]